MYATGANNYGQLGLGDNTNRTVFAKVDPAPWGLDKPVAVTTGNLYTILLTESDGVYATGQNYSGQLGLGDNTTRNTFTKINPASWGPDKPVAVTVGGDGHTILLTENGDIHAAGDNDYGQLGQGSSLLMDVKSFVKIQVTP